MVQELNIGLSRKDKWITKMEQGIIDFNAQFDKQSQELDEAKLRA